MTDYDIDPYIWFANREVEFFPKHFVLSNTPLTMESKQWVLDKLKGRFCVVQSGEFFLIDYCLGNIAFEDPSEATFYELKWS